MQISRYQFALVTANDTMAKNMLLQVLFLSVAVCASPQMLQMNFNPQVFNTSLKVAGDIAACSEGGPACDPTCQKTGVCIKSGNGFEFHETADCGDHFCNKQGNTVSCSATETGECIPNKAEHGCDTDGIFPDLYNCRNVINCKKNQVGTSQTICLGDVSFDGCTGYCDVHLPEMTCEQQTAKCKAVGEVYTYDANNRIYYYCVKDADGLLHPVIGRCSKGYFNKQTYSCEDSKVPGCVTP